MTPVQLFEIVAIFIIPILFLLTLGLDFSRYRSKLNYAVALLLLGLIVLADKTTHIDTYTDTALSKITESQLQRISTTLEQFRLHTNRYPTADEGMEALISRPKSISSENWHGPYVNDLFPDPWNHPLVYIGNDGSSFQLYSTGKDGVSNSNGNDLDDINTWNKQKQWRSYYQGLADTQRTRGNIIRNGVDALYLLLFGYLIIRCIRFKSVYRPGVRREDDG